MSVNDETDHPWLAKEKEFIRRAIEAGKPVLGICLGAQLIADAKGAIVVSNSTKEIGWFPVESVSSEHASVFQFPDVTEVFHWHAGTFDLPEGAAQIARSKGCENQAFPLGSNVILACNATWKQPRNLQKRLSTIAERNAWKRNRSNQKR